MSSAERPAVLLVDDNEATSTLVTAILQRDFRTEIAGDGMEAIERLRTNQYAAILLDLRMPQYDGFTVLEFLKTNQPKVLPTVLVVTALLGKRETERARSYGICDIIAKPFEVETLLEAVRRCVGQPLDGGTLGRSFFCSSPVILLIADLLKNRML